jgi:hypothetical protein
MNAVVLFDREDRYDVRIVERGYNASFALKARKAFGITRHLRRQQLQRDVAAQGRVCGAIHLAHPAGSNRSHDAIVRERPIDQISPLGNWSDVIVSVCARSSD